MKGILKMTRRLIRKTPGRFFSLFAIVLLGTAFYIGVSAISVAMSTSVNRYDDLLNLKDITIYSNYGFDEADVEAVRSLDSVAAAEGASFVDVYCVYEDSSAITRVHSLSPDNEINQVVLRSGRLPERKDEVLADNGTVLMPGYELGTVLQLTRPDDDLGDTLSVDRVTVVGTIDTPLYLNETREASTLSNLYIQTFLYIPEDAFFNDYYTEMNVLIKDGKTYDEFSDEYRDYSASVKEEIKGFAVSQKEKRRSRLKNEAMDSYNEGLEEYEEGLAEYNDAIAEAEREIRNAEKELADGWKEVRSAQNTLNDAQAELDIARDEYTAQIEDGRKQLEEGERELAEGKEEFSRQKTQYLAQRDQLNAVLTRLNEPVISEDMTLAEALQYIPEEEQGQVQALADTLGIDLQSVTAGEVLAGMKENVTPETVAEMKQIIEEAMQETEVTETVIEDGEVPFPVTDDPAAEGDEETKPADEPLAEDDPEPASGGDSSVQPAADASAVQIDPNQADQKNDNETPQSSPEEESSLENGKPAEPVSEPDNGISEPLEEETQTGEGQVTGESSESVPEEENVLLPSEETVSEPIAQRYVQGKHNYLKLLGNDDSEEEPSSSEHTIQYTRPAPETMEELAEIIGNDSAAFRYLSQFMEENDITSEEAVKDLDTYADLVLQAEVYLEKAMTEPLPDSVTLGELASISDEVSVLKEQLGFSDDTTLGEVRSLLRENIAKIDEGLEEGQAAIDAGETELQNGREELAKAEAELNQKLAEGQAEIDNGWAELTDSITLLTDGRKTLNSSIAEFEREKADGKQKLDDAKAELDDALAQIEEMEEAEWTVLDRSQHYSSETYRGTINQMAAIARIFPVFFLAVAALVCLTTMTRLVNEERGQIGILRALGYGSSQCSFIYLTYAGLAGILGCAAGTAVGLATFPIIIYNTWKMLYILPKMQMEIPWKLILTASAVFILMMMAVTEYVLYGDMKEVPSVIMRPKAPKVGKDIILEKVGIIWNRISFSWKITIRNLARYKRRMLMTVLGVGGCTALLVTGFGISDSINNIVNIQFNEISNFDARVYLEKEDGTYADYEKVKQELLAMEGSDAVYPVAEYSGMVSLDGENEEVATVEVFKNKKTLTSVYNVRERVGHAPLTPEKGSVIISEKMAENLSISVGDEILLESRDGEKTRVPVSGIMEMYVYHYVMMTEDTYRMLYQSVPEVNTLFLRLEEGVEPEESLKAATAAVEGVDSVDFVDFVIRNFETMIQGIDGVVIVLIAASMGLAFVVLGNLTNVNISERMREIATLKVLGFRRREVQNYIYHENNIMVALGALVGLPAGKLLSGYIMREVELTNVMFGRGVEPSTYVWAFALTILFGVAVNTVMRKKLNSVKMVESLKSVE